MSEDKNEIKIGQCNGSTIVRVTEFKGKKYVDIRKFQQFDGPDGNKLYPTKKGLSLALDNLSDLIDLLSTVEERKAKDDLNVPA